jgi:hypothetical protein
MLKRSITRLDLLKLAGALPAFVGWAVLIYYLMPVRDALHPWLFSLQADVGAGLVCFGAFCVSYLREFIKSSC